MGHTYSSHLNLAHFYWKNFLKKGDIVIDATCGNGQDSLFLAKLVLTNHCGKIFLFDIQKKAIENTTSLLKKHLIFTKEQISIWHQSHEDFSCLQKEGVKLVVYNLGYLPKGDKSITTKRKTTLRSLRSAISILQPKGAICITCYPGHREGQKEEKQILSFLSQFNPKLWNICYHKWINKTKGPTLFWLQKLI